jgi:hypothetical protein
MKILSRFDNLIFKHYLWVLSRKGRQIHCVQYNVWFILRFLKPLTLTYFELYFFGFFWETKKILEFTITLFTFLYEPVIRTDSLGISHIYTCIFYFIFFLEDCNKARTFSIPTVFSHLDKFLSFRLKNDSIPFLFIRKCRNHKSQFFNWSSSTFITMIGRANYF